MKRRRLLGGLLSGIVATLCMTAVAMAAGINSHEQRVLDTVSQPFSYNGKTYVVNSGNIAEGRNKLASENVDLTAADADECISQFHRSYQELVEEGYCTVYGDASKDEEEESKTTPEPQHSNKENSRNREFLATILGEPVEETPEPEESQKPKKDKDTGASTVENTPAPATPSPTPNVWQQQEATAESISFEKKDINNAKEARLVLEKGSRRYTIQPSEEGQKVDRYTARYLSVWKGVLIGTLVLSVGVLAGMLWYIFCIKGRFRKKKKRKRKVLTVLMGVTIAIWTGLLVAAFGLYFGLYNASALQRQLMESNYFSGAAQMLQEQEAERISQAGYNGAVAEEIFSLSNIYIGEKQYIGDILSGTEGAELSVEKIHGKLTATLNQKADTDAALIEAIETDYKNILHFEVGNRIRISREAWLPWFYLTVIPGVCFICIFSGLLYYICSSLHTVTGAGASGMLAAALVAALVAAIVKLCHPEEGLRAFPAFYQEFICSTIRWDIQVILYVSGIAILLAGGLLIWRYRSVKKWGKD